MALDLELRYFRDTGGRQVDFVVTDRLRPCLPVECTAPALRFLQRLA